MDLIQFNHFNVTDVTVFVKIEIRSLHTTFINYRMIVFAIKHKWPWGNCLLWFDAIIPPVCINDNKPLDFKNYSLQRVSVLESLYCLILILINSLNEHLTVALVPGKEKKHKLHKESNCAWLQIKSNPFGQPSKQPWWLESETPSRAVRSKELWWCHLCWHFSK